jgi:prepilin-type N-terminal cleavage/methylation domain-containing protein
LKTKTIYDKIDTRNNLRREIYELIQNIKKYYGGGVKPVSDAPFDTLETKNFQHKTPKLQYRKTAFTLAEVLITIGIIGIVAGMTIPTIAHKIRNKILETQFKNTYAKVTQAIKRMQADMDVTDIGTYCSSWNGSAYINRVECLTAFKNAFNTDTQASVNYLKYTKSINRTNIAIFSTTSVTAVDNDGCHRSLFRQYAMSDGSYMGYNICGMKFLITFDVNGAAKPNRLGYDIFMLYIANDKTAQLVGFKPSTVTDEDLQNYWEKLEASDIKAKDFYYSTYGNPCNYTSTQTFNGKGCGYYAIRNQCPDGSNKGYFECLK